MSKKRLPEQTPQAAFRAQCESCPDALSHAAVTLPAILGRHPARSCRSSGQDDPAPLAFAASIVFSIMGRTSLSHFF